MRKKRNLVSVIIAGIVVLLLVGLTIRGFEFLKKIGVRGTTTATSKPKTQFNIALLGYGGGTHDGAYLTDTVIVAHVDVERNKVLLISLPRDIWVPVPTTSGSPFNLKLNALYQIGLFPTDFPDVKAKYGATGNNALLLKETLGKITGLPIDAYVAADFSSFTRTIDLLGGIDITVDTAFVDPVYPIDGKEKDLCGKDEQFKQVEKYLTQPNQDEMAALFKDKPELKEFFDNITDAPEKAFPCRYETLNFSTGLTHLTGEQALKFVRSRHSLQDGTDFGRAARQQKVLIAVKNKVLSIGFIPRILPLIKELEGHVVTDISYDEISKFIGEFKDAKLYKIDKLVLSDKNYLVDDFSTGGQFILRPKLGLGKWDEVHAAINNTILGITPTPTPNLTIVPTKKLAK